MKPVEISRRKFMTTAAGTLAAAGAPGAWAAASPARPAGVAAVKIERLEVFPVRYTAVMPFRFLEGPTGNGRPAVFVKLTTDDGTVGWGQSVPVPRWTYETLESALIVLEHYLRPTVIGKDPFDIHGIHAAMNREICPSFSTGYPLTKAGIDLALHDLVGKLTGRNVAELWGRKPGREITLSWTVASTKLEEIPGLVDEGLRRGFEHFNVKVAPDPDYDIKVCRIVKERVPDGFLWCDANGQYDLASALRAAPKLADLGVPVLEQPIPINQISGYQRLVKQHALPILLDEGMVSATELIEYIRLGCCDGVAMKPARCGGLLPAREQIEVLEKSGLMFLGSGLTDPDVSLAASLILFSAYGLRFPAALNGLQFLGESVLTEPFQLTRGKLRVPQGPGLGVTVDEAALRDLVQRSNVKGRICS
jgi:L-alanine-DL-glutamate epimerase-like enolase superfamily enzyme